MSGAGGGIACVVVLMCILWTGYNSSGYTDVQPVPVQEWQPGRPFKHSLSRQTTPVVLTNAAFERWPARKKWTPEYLTEALRGVSLHNVYRSRNAVFGPVFNAERPLGSLEAVRPVNAHELTTMSIEELWEAFEHHSSDAHYYSGELNRQNFPASLLKDVSPLEPFLLTSQSSVNVWLGEKGVTALAHYDSYVNFYVQLHGEKRFQLFAPSVWRRFHGYPFLHPSHAQARANLSQSEWRDAVLRDLPRDSAFEVVLKPGQMLYIPSMWVHEVTAMTTPSISVNAWSTTSHADRLRNMMQHLHTYTSSKPELLSRRREVARGLIERVLAVALQLPSASAVWEFVAGEVVESRYRPLLDDGTLPSSPPTTDWCSRPQPPLEISAALVESLLRELTQIPEYCRVVYAGDWTEAVAVWACTKVELAGAWLQSCVNAS